MPGPGRPKPAPKNVATIQAQSGAFTRGWLVDISVVLVVVAMTFLLRFLHALDVFGIGDRAGDHVTTAGPLSKIDEAAALAAEREVRIFAQHKLAARRTA